ncbi:MAG TPA: Ig-like domain-containing protein, partial [Gemmatimonadales bacterium]|nr:Ig-like domain-containing protein [Gemmatimonadales bacterium]
SPTLSAVAVSSASIVAGSGVSVITVTVKDNAGNPVPGASVVLSATGSGNTITQPQGPTDANGQAAGSLSSTGAGSKTVMAVAGGVTIAQQPVVTVSAGPPDPGVSTLSANPLSITAGTAPATITTTVRDQFGNPVSGVTVVLSATGTGNSLIQPTSPTNASGVATGTLGSTVAGDKVVSATANGVAITQSATVTVAAPPTGAVTHALLTSGHDVINQRVYTTAPIAPAANTLVTVAVMTHQSSAAAPSPTVTGGGMASWDVVATVTFDGTTPLKRITIFRAMSAAPGSGAITITSSVTVSNCQWIVSQWAGVATSGTNGSGAVVQTGAASGTAVNQLMVTLAPFASTANVAYGVFGVNSNVVPTVSPGTGFTKIDEQPSGEGTLADLFAEWAVNRNAVTASWSNKNAGALAVELKAGP